ncbi:MAG: LysR family transcriptional regulator [Sphingomonadales bacterium RIFCSPHIGHO2_01_FULL_65_20]|jgi:DNA-binding transcriptional LysR family regulator|uniref:LysR family transcriptional regulator n=1 Tax=unclassified Blastomonas TaxID=2626550 RepID=UPI0008321CDD|nr:LysR family transcriptional regulator [Blastomonas sp.]MCH2239975.1 LysR family transcriptional regulator [Blastomonas sp.]OHC97852.1 MAG: LysR family transcriptional regulator [Sphingomonadales bacterium RIFCSPHIGHO2_01_FULL_65_20]
MSRQGLIEFDAVLAIARRGSFRAAALELGVSTTSLSNLISALERRLGVRLFNRTTRSVSLTDAGRNFVDQVAPAVATLHDAMLAASAQQESPSGTIRINAFPTAAREILAPLLLPFLRRYPQVHVDLVTEGRIVDIVAEGFDLGLRSAELVPSDMIAIPVGPPRRFAVVASPAYLEAHGMPETPPDLMRHRCLRIRLPNGALHRWQFERDGQPFQIDVEGPITLDEASLARIAALENMGIGYFMESDVREDLEAGRMVRLLADWTPPLARLCLYYPNRRNASAAFRALIEMARRSFG